MKELTRSVAGIRGIWGESLFPAIAADYAAAFGTYISSGTVIIGQDTRTTGNALKFACVAGLLAVGCEVKDIGIVPTPTCQLNVKEKDVAGGIVITASHNPGEWNGLKFLSAAGELLNENENEKFLDIVDNNRIEYKNLKQSKHYYQSDAFNQEAINRHIDKICAFINYDLIRRKNFKVILDACNGAGSRLLIPLLQKLNAQIIEMNCLENGIFPHDPEPMPEHITALCDLVKSEKADAGFAVDPDADRLSIVSNEGIALGEDMTLPLVAQYLLKKKAGTVVTNHRTSRSIDFVAQKFNSKVIRTKIGEANVVMQMKENNCLIGGEGNGGIIVPAVQYTRDSGIGIGIILESMAVSGQQISEIAAMIPSFYVMKKKIDCPAEKIPVVYNSLKQKYASESINNIDGIKISWNDRWLHIRESGTENFLRVYAEAPTPELANKLINDAIADIKLIKK